MPLKYILAIAGVLTTILFFATVEAEQLDDVQLRCHYEASVAQSVQIVRSQPDMAGLSYGQFVVDTNALFNRGGPLAPGWSAEQIAAKDAWLDSNQQIALAVFHDQRLQYSPEQVFASFYDVCLIRDHSEPVWEGG